MSKAIRLILLVVATIFLVLVSLQSLAVATKGSHADMATVANKLNKVIPGSAANTSNDVPKIISQLDDLPLVDNQDIYAEDDPGSLVTMYLTIREGNSLENTNHTWQQVNDATKFFFEHMAQTTVPKAEAILQVGDEHGPLPNGFGYGETVANSTVQIRGGSSSMYAQKSYKIELFDGGGDWRGQTTIALNKHWGDLTRARAKLTFDLLKSIPNVVSLRTQYVHLYVKDETATPPETAYRDYGLYTQIEQPNRRFLRNHLLDRYGQLYKATFFEFFRYPDKIRAADDPL